MGEACDFWVLYDREVARVAALSDEERRAEIEEILSEPVIDRHASFKPFGPRQRRLLWRKKPNTDLCVGDILSSDGGGALRVLSIDARGVLVKRITPGTAKSTGECFILGHSPISDAL